eukprot:Amastigsp_a678948_10.p2 type:complete len:218 gc:universal Amastigsp_a678948_10:800-147(-)
MISGREREARIMSIVAPPLTNAARATRSPSLGSLEKNTPARAPAFESLKARDSETSASSRVATMATPHTPTAASASVSGPASELTTVTRSPSRTQSGGFNSPAATRAIQPAFPQSARMSKSAHATLPPGEATSTKCLSGDGDANWKSPRNRRSKTARPLSQPPKASLSPSLSASNGFARKKSSCLSAIAAEQLTPNARGASDAESPASKAASLSTCS